MSRPNVLETIVAPERTSPVEVETAPGDESVTDEDSLSDRPWHVVLLDDNQHSYDYVIEMLGAIFRYDLPRAFVMACEVDVKGRVIVATCHLEHAEAYQERIHDYGPDWRIPTCKGSMSAVLEPAR